MNRSYVPYIFLFLFVLGLSTCSLVPGELKTAEQLIETAPDSALHILQNLSPGKYKSPSNRALYGLLMIQTLDKNLLPLKPDSLLDFSIQYYENHPFKDRLATCYLYKGRMYKYAFQYEKAIEYYLKALDETRNSKNNSLLGRINLDLGDIYNEQGDYTQSRKKFKVAFDYFSVGNFQVQAFYSLLYIGRTYHEAKDYKTSENYYRRIIGQAKDSMQQGALYQEMGLNFFDSKRLDSALIYFRRIIKYPYIGNNRAIRYHLLSSIYFDLKQFDSAYYYASNSFRFDPHIRTQRDCYRIMTNCKFIKGNTDSVTVYMNKYVALGDSIRKIDAQAKGSYMESKHSTELKYIKTRKGLWFSFGFILLIIAGSYLLYTRLYRRNKQEKIRIQETQSEVKVGRLITVIDNKAAVLNKKIEERKKEVLSEFKTAGIEVKEKQIKKIYDDFLHINDTRFFLKEMDTDLNNLVTKLQNRYNGLNEKELFWCCLHLLRISNNDMLIIFDYKNENSLKALKKRLLKKFNLDSITHFRNFLIDILSED